MRILMLSKCEQDYYGDVPSFMKLGTCQLLFLTYRTLQKSVEFGILNSWKKWKKESIIQTSHPVPNANGLSIWRKRTHRTVHRHLRLRLTPADRFAVMEGCKHTQGVMEYNGSNPTNQLGLGSSTRLFIG